MRRLGMGIVAGVGLLVSLALMGRGGAQPDRAGSPGVDTVRAERRDIGVQVKATGVIRPMVGAEVKVGSRASGVVARLHVRIGDPVRKGQRLAELDDRELRARRDQAEAALLAARAQLEYAAVDLRRKRELFASRLIAALDLDLAERAHAVAREERAEAEANLAYARTQLEYARIDAPISGVVSSVSTQEGETVSASLAAPTFVTLIDLERLEVWAYVDETDIGRIQVGQEARFTVATYLDHEFEGRVVAVYPRAEIRDNVVNYVAVVSFDPPADRTLRPEMTTTVNITVGGGHDVLAVPRGAVRSEAGRTVVDCREGDRVVTRPVTTGVRDEAYWEIVDGLREGEPVLVTNAR
jgi:RND family efflux transporter MFP subunit